jgi:hypothetical protein
MNMEIGHEMTMDVKKSAINVLNMLKTILLP